MGSGMPAGLTHIEAEPDCWWYATALPGGGAKLAFHTDGDLPAARTARSNSAVLARAKALPMLGGLFGSGTWTQPTAGFCAAHAARLESPVGRDWIAVGDAALAFDPLASQGLLNALHTGLAGAEAAHRHLAGHAGALPGYAAELQQVSEVYHAHRAAWYGIERRWRDRSFWQRRGHAER